jgi:hypothetical protein
MRQGADNGGHGPEDVVLPLLIGVPDVAAGGGGAHARSKRLAGVLERNPAKHQVGQAGVGYEGITWEASNSGKGSKAGTPRATV